MCFLGAYVPLSLSPLPLTPLSWPMSHWCCWVWGEAGLWALHAGSLALHPPCLHPGLVPAHAQLCGQGKKQIHG